MSRLCEIDKVLHSIPEIGLKEYKTAEFIRNSLSERGIPYDISTETGTLVYFQGDDPKITAFRADIDALPLADSSNHISPSLNGGLSHACGHSGHASALLETIFRLDERIKKGMKLKKSLLFIFQPGEEGVGGAKYVIKSESFKKYKDRIKCFFATHVKPDIYQGVVSIREGYLSAQNINLKWDIEGQGCHGAYPHTGIDIVVVVSELIGAYQTIRSRNIDPDDMYILTIGKFLTGSKVDGKFEPGGARNIIPNNIELEGTIRVFDPKYIEISQKRMESINRGYEEAYGIKINMDFQPNYPPMVNDHKLYRDISGVLRNLDIKYETSKKMTGSEDFSFYRNIAPTFMFFTGIRDEEKGHTAPLHSPSFGYDFQALETIIKIYMGIIDSEEI